MDDWRLVHHCGDNDAPFIVADDDPKAEIKRMRHRMPGAPDPATWDQQEYELFDLKSDPSEMKNVAAEHPDVVAKLKVIMQQQHTPSDLFPIRGVDPAKKKNGGEIRFRVVAGDWRKEQSPKPADFDPRAFFARCISPYPTPASERVAKTGIFRSTNPGLRCA